MIPAASPGRISVTPNTTIEMITRVTPARARRRIRRRTIFASSRVYGLRVARRPGSPAPELSTPGRSGRTCPRRLRLEPRPVELHQAEWMPGEAAELVRGGRARAPEAVDN